MNGEILFYKNYTTIVEYSQEEDLYSGEVIGIQDLIMFETHDPSRVLEEFQESVDGYLNLCKEVNKIPQIPFEYGQVLKTAGYVKPAHKTATSSLANSQGRLKIFQKITSTPSVVLSSSWLLANVN